MKLLDIAEHSGSRSVLSAYRALPCNAGDCNQCGVCEDRCPFDVPVITRMEKAVEVFAPGSA